jgi:galactose mutarotase-like enzyme
MTDAPSNWITFGSAELTAAVDPLGAQLSILRDRAGRDLLWNGDPAVWSGRAPLLFPIVGALAGGSYRVGVKRYQLPRHGFARQHPFEVVERGADRAAFRLRADPSSLQVFPFDFVLDVRFELRAAALSVKARLSNTGNGPLPASFGFHPAFRWPLPYGEPRAAHFMEFAQSEPRPVRRLDSAGLLTPERHPTPVVNRRLALEDSLFQNDALIFDALDSRSIDYSAAAGPKIRVSFPDTPYLGLWSKPGAGFICIEPWHGIADPQGFAGDFSTKPGVFTLAPGVQKSIEMTVSLVG